MAEDTKEGEGKSVSWKRLSGMAGKTKNRDASQPKGYRERWKDNRKR